VVREIAVMRGGGLRRQIEFELLDQQFLFSGEFGVAAEDQGDLNGGELVEHGSTK
jgi:hypothetical protein